jgi:glucokinase
VRRGAAPEAGTVILAGDIGGTKTNLGLFEESPAGLRPAATATFASAAYPGLAAVVKEFLGQPAALAAMAPPKAPPASLGAASGAAESSGPAARSVAGVPAAACFGIAGPVDGNRSKTPNLAWEIDGNVVAAELGLPAVRLVNDLYATAEGIPLLTGDQLRTLQEGAAPGPAPANQVLIAAGTGLGMALMPVGERGRITVPSEGGHADYAARDEDETALLLYLRRRFGEHVSTERVVSGRGLRAIYDFLRDSGYAAESPEVRVALEADDPSRVIAEAGLAGTDALSSRALDMFTAAYGAAAGNLALVGTATGGVYIGGGIAPKILPKLTGGLFLRAFLDKGRFASYLARIPIRVVLDDRTAMLGAARCAAAMVAPP